LVDRRDASLWLSMAMTYRPPSAILSEAAKNLIAKDKCSGGDHSIHTN